MQFGPIFNYLSIGSLMVYFGKEIFIIGSF